MSTLKLLGDSSGYVQLVANTAAQNNTLTLPNVNDTLANITSPTFLSNIALAGTGTAPSVGLFTPSANTLAFATNTTQVITINSTGNVGINSTSPQRLLDIEQSGTTYQLRIGDGGGAYYYDIGRNVSNGLFTFYGSQTGATGYVFSSVDGERLRINTAGALLVNTTTQSGSTRVVIADSTGAGQLRVIYSTGNGLLIAQTSASGDAAIQLQDAANLQFATSNAERMRITSAGNILMATTSLTLSATAELWFNGQVQQGLNIKNTVANQSGAAIRFIDSTGAFTGGGIYFTVSSSVSYSASSDARLKTNISALDGSLSIINGLNPVKFNWKADSSPGEGFLAHELQQLVPLAVIGDPDAVDADGKPSYQVADYSKIIPRLVAAIQELTAKVEALEAKVGKQ